jgi:hypothetical protein
MQRDVPRRVTDPVFGEMALDTVWTGRVSVSLFGETIDLTVDTGDAYWLPCLRPPTEEQRQTFLHFNQICKEMHGSIEEALFKYYQEVRPLYCSDGRKQAEIDEDVPILTSPPQIWQLLSNPSLFIPNQNHAPNQLCLWWKCSWDWNREVEVLFKDSAVKKVRVAGEVYDDGDE